jgi:glycosyltransferase involved in cell wall biosynthesis
MSPSDPSGASRRLLILCHDFPPEIAGVRRVLKFCELLPAHGIVPAVVAPRPFAATGYDPAPLRAIEEAGIEVVRTPSRDPHWLRHRLPADWSPDDPPPPWLAPSKAVGNAGEGSPDAGRAAVARQKPAALRWAARQVRRWAFFPDDRAPWIPFAVRAAEDWLRAHPGAALMTTSFPHSVHVAGLRLKRRIPGLRWLADFRDGWTQNADFFDPPTPWHARRHRRAEAAVASEADLLFAVSPPIAEHFADLRANAANADSAGGREAVALVANGYDERDAATARDAAREIRASRPAGAPSSLVYTGSLFGKRGAEPLLRALATLRDEGTPFRLDLYARLKPEEEALAASLGLLSGKDGGDAPIAVRGFVPHAEALAAQAAADALLLLVEPGPRSAIMMTQKVFEYLGAGRPILAAAPRDSACGKLLAEVGAGTFADPADPASIAAGLRSLCREASRGAGAAPEGRPPDAIAAWSRQAQVAKAAELMRRFLFLD